MTWMAVVVATVVVPAATPAPAPGIGLSLTGAGSPSATAPSRPTLRIGARGAAVRVLQERLRITVDGQFGPGTHRAVVAFQAARKLLADGVVGPRTWQALNGSGPTAVSALAASGRPTLRLGANGPAVAEAQRLLTAASHRTATDGRFGPGTHTSVVALQRARRLAADGVIGPATWAALGSAPLPLVLISAPPPEPWRTIGARSYAVRPGDTLASVAAATRSTASALATVNRIAPSSRLPVGATLLVPGSWRCVVPGAGFVNDYGFARAGHLHQGNDMFAVRGTPVLAPVAGRVEQREGGLGGRAANLYGADGHRYYFAHLDRWGAKGSVAAGAVIGYVGNTGNALTTIPHLHFEIHPGGGGPINPFPTLTLACRH